MVSIALWAILYIKYWNSSANSNDNNAISILFLYRGVWGIEILAVDIAILFISILAGQLMALHFYNYSKGINSNIAIAILILLITIFAIFTFNPPQLPIFQDSLTGQYGIG